MKPPDEALAAFLDSVDWLLTFVECAIDNGDLGDPAAFAKAATSVRQRLADWEATEWYAECFGAAS